ncbi:VOC family protein [Streptomyces sp. CAI-21]|uniref:3-demethylubiquinone-9 3-methyltransferase n=2 Tax=Streptomyces TaxID=1883 RepID=D6B6Y8_9ACTN|nr:MULTISPECIES: VOC family protein [Streptomyces]MYQ71011.1 VOC family protein [Streptomyces sp. SID4934]MYX83626.1 VOC family protein [Streptomyces sp. SID4915]NUW05456.1 VOC family protein [Streptomyces sp. CAI-21]QLA60173.1 VOC family protein [Streptomyces violascens]SCD65449.1 Glyoxalase superfamily enzyme, possibly 3-demethylubiquinone-9 3-methyltransferase [Streptomyces sp. IgraMP-1]BDH54709.1 putative 3-demethylubiquinone-9 3-methyltransferase [Streptomyces albus]
MQKITTNLWFDGQAEEAAAFYTSLFEDARILGVERFTDAGPGEPGSVVTVTFQLAGQEFVAINGGPEFTFTEAISLSVDCETQEEVDRYWAALTADGGEEVQCGWLKDKYGLSWQIVPRALVELLASSDREAATRATRAMLEMKKLDIQALRDAAAGL